MLAAALVVSAASVAAGQIDTPTRTPWGDPDIQGVFTTDDLIDVPLQRPGEFGERLYMNEEEYREAVERLARQDARFSEEFGPSDPRVTVNPPGHWLEWGDEASRQTSLIIDPPDGRMPSLAAGAEERRALGSFSPNNPQTVEDFTLYIRCITRGVTGSILPVIYGNGTRIVQSPGYVAIANEMVHEARIIPLADTPHADEDIRMYMGSSRGHWEGDTLVVETRNLTDRTGVAVNGGGNRHSENMVLTERFTRIAPDRVQYEATFNDPETWTEPWTVGYPLTEKSDYQIYEYACHEGNNAMRNMLSAARAREAEAGN
jgi:hypothetical protein